MNKHAARILSISLFGIYLAMLLPGLYIQWRTGEILYDSVLVPLPTFIFGGIVLAAWSVLGVLIVWHYSRNPIGWIMCIFPLDYALSHFSWGYYLIRLESNSSSQAALVWQNWSDYPVDMLIMGLFFLLYPTGRPLSSRWGRVAWFGVVASLGYYILEALMPGPIYSSGNYYQNLVNPIGLNETLWGSLRPLHTILWLTSMIFLISSIGSLAVRLRRSRGEERQQIKWFAYFALIFLLAAIGVFISDFVTYIGLLYHVATFLVVIVLMGMAVAIAIAIFKYRLYAIDIIIRRTLVYGALTGFLAISYLTSVILIQGVLTAVGSPRTAVATVLSTLLIAALFTPLRRWVQDAIDRRFYRQKYDAENALSTFSAQARDEMNLETLSESLLRVVDDTFHPKSSSLWLLDIEAKSGRDP